MLRFNASGYLTPSGMIRSNVSEMEKTFVVEFSSVERSILFDMYLNYSQNLKKTCGNIELYQWINGSFVTKQKQRPGDIDMVTFIDADIIKNTGDKIKPFTYPYSKKNYPGVDAYIIEVHGKNSQKHKVFESDRAYWHQQFDTTRRNRKGKKLSKGFLEIIY